MTKSPVFVSGTTALVEGQVVSDTTDVVEYWVEYGPTSAYGSETDRGTVGVTANTPVSVYRDLAGLERSATYHYRFCARDSRQSGGPRCGEDRQFTTVNVDCGDVITADLRLSADLTCFGRGGGDVLAVGADGIVVDLGGHHVVATGGAAIANRRGFDDVTIRSGRLSAFDSALVLNGASRNRVLGVAAGVDVPGVPDFRTSTGISITGGQGNMIRGATLIGEGTGLSVIDSDRLLVEGSSGRARFGAALQLRADLVRVRNNDATSAQGAGLFVQGSNNRIVGNRIAQAVIGIEVRSGDGNVVAENEAVESRVMFVPEPEDTPYGDGIFVNSLAIGTLLRANVANGNEADGIEVLRASTRLRDNTATDNGRFGIDAVEGVIDLGGNTASGNGNPLQCRNVFCG